MSQRFFSVALVSLLAACASEPPTPDWQLNAQDSLKRGAEAYLEGNARVESSEFARARSEVARTGRMDMLARVALTRCASEVASLVMTECAAFEALRVDAPNAERAYADYLLGRSNLDVSQLPERHRVVAGVVNDVVAVNAVKAIVEPQARLIAAGVVFRRNQASPALIDLAIETASSQGWRRPLLAWLGVKLKRAEVEGDKEAGEQIRRRIKLVADNVVK